MGMYWQVAIGISIEPDEKSLAVLNYLDDHGEKPAPEDLPPFELFKEYPWRRIGQADSAYFPGTAYFVFMKCIGSGNEYELNCSFNCKDPDLIQEFIIWVGAMASKDVLRLGEFLGTFRYEEDEVPELLFWTGSGIVFIRPEVPTLKKLLDGETSL